MSVCPKCGAEVELNASFCENCGAAVSQHNQYPQKGSSVMGDKNVVAGDVIGQKVAGDNVQNKIMGDVVYNVVQDESKKVVSCAICGKHIITNQGHTCPKCKKIVCAEHFDRYFLCCHVCSREKRNDVIVDSLGNGDFCSISEALMHAVDGANIVVRPGIYREHFIIDKFVTIVGENGEDGNAPIILGFLENDNPCIQIKAPAIIKNLSVCATEIDSSKRTFSELLSPDNSQKENEVHNPPPKKNPAILINGNAKLDGVSVFEWYADAIVVDGRNVSPKITNCTIHNNQGTGVVIRNRAAGKIESCHIYENRIFNVKICDGYTNPHILNCKIYNSINEGFQNAGIYIDEAASKIENCDIFGNEENILVNTGGATPHIVNCKIHNAEMCGISISGTYFDSKFPSSPKIENCDIFENEMDNIFMSFFDEYAFVVGCKIHDAKENGVRIGGEVEGTVKNCEIFNNGKNNIEVEGDSPEKEYASPKIIACEIHHATECGIFVHDGNKPSIINCSSHSNGKPDVFQNREDSVERKHSKPAFTKETNDKKPSLVSKDDEVAHALLDNIVSSPLNKESNKNADIHKPTNASVPSPENSKHVLAKDKNKEFKTNKPATSKSGFEPPKDALRPTNIDWSKDTPTTIEEWNKLSPEQKQDWANWHKKRSQFIFATIAILLEIILSIIVLVDNEQGVGITVLIVIATLAGIICTGVFRKILYKVLRALVVGGLTGTLAAILSSLFFDEEPLHTVSIVLSYALFIAIFGIIESKGGMDRKIPKFPQK